MEITIIHGVHQEQKAYLDGLDAGLEKHEEIFRLKDMKTLAPKLAH